MSESQRPNILVAISDDQAWPHTSAYGCRFVNTPAFDRVAHEGVLFDNGFCPAPQCSPSRAGLLTGMNMWEMEEGALLWSRLPAKYDVYPDLLEAHGYRILEEQARGRWAVEVDGEDHEVDLYADMIVERGGARFVAEIKTGDRAPDPLRPATRRQLLEYLLAFEPDGLLLVDMDAETIHTVAFPGLEE